MEFNLDNLLWGEHINSSNVTRIVNSPGRASIGKSSIDMMLWNNTLQGGSYWGERYYDQFLVSEEDKQYVLGVCRNTCRLNRAQPEVRDGAFRMVRINRAIGGPAVWNFEVGVRDN